MVEPTDRAAKTFLESLPGRNGSILAACLCVGRERRVYVGGGRAHHHVGGAGSGGPTTTLTSDS